MPSYFLGEAEAKDSCLAGWMGPPTAAQSSAPRLFIDVSGVRVAGYESEWQNRVQLEFTGGSEHTSHNHWGDTTGYDNIAHYYIN